MTEERKLKLIGDAIAKLPPHSRDGVQGDAWIWLSENESQIVGQADGDIVGRLVYHIEYTARRERRRPLPIIDDVPAHDTGVEEVEIMDELSPLTPADKSIISMIIAGNTRREVGTALGISAAGVSRAIKRIRAQYQARSAGPGRAPDDG